jgi:zinc protease
MRKTALLLTLLLVSASIPALSQERFRRIPPSPDPIKRLELPEIQTYVLANELAVTVVQKTGAPILSIKMVISSGEKAAPDELPGLASYTANMVMRSTEELSSADIDDRIESMGGVLEAAIYADFTIFTLSFLEEYLDDALDLLSRMMTKSTFPQREITNVKTSLFYAMVQRSTDAEYVARRLLFKKLFTEDSYGKITYSEDAITKMDRNSAVEFYDRYYRPNNARIILAGNLNLQTATRKVSHYFNMWTKSNQERRREPLPHPSSRIKLCFIASQNMDETVIMMGNLISPLEKSDYFPFSVFNQVFGETPNSRLFLNLRESKGFAYNAYSHIEMFNGFALLRVQALVRPEVTTDAIKEIFAELDRTQKRRIPNTEIEGAKSYLIGNFPVGIDGIDEFSARIADLVNLNLGKDHWNGYYDAIMRISADSVSQVIEDKELLSPVIVVVGDKDLVLDDLVRELGDVEIYDQKGTLVQTINREQRRPRE